ncbi:hypothetical protein [Sporomusa termitida]|uniref:Uncharacterized protein n=1 Tax=Sporomusa termitida TaxID=2377 RepID=A0A517DQV7_9FIRM|nr:hypothetical protein [Sporomusa termitida]QDR79735.1 hypothetical protein SPTER_10300 [Sporomusa termitida]
MSLEKNHPQYEIPSEPHAKLRYESAKKHAQSAKAAGKSAGEIHEIFRKVMNADLKNLADLPQDEAHQKYRSALMHARKAIENGKTPAEAHSLFRNIITAQTTGQGHH